VLSLPSVVAGDGTGIEQWRLQAAHYSTDIISTGAAITRLDVPDRTGQVKNVVLGHANLADYLRGRDYFGAIVGRLANRLAYGRLRLDGREYELTRNDGEHHLHGGRTGFDKRTWQATETGSGEQARLVLALESPDGEEGYPGTLRAQVRYVLRPEGVLEVELEASCDRLTVVNLTNHSYFNLRGEGEGNVLGHRLMIAADEYLPVDAELIPTGQFESVEGTPFDFRRPALIGSRITRPHDQLKFGGGFDHCFVLARSLRPAPALAARLEDPASGRWLELFTDRPGLQFYSGNFLDRTSIGAAGTAYGPHAGLCLETQDLPDAPNHAGFPSVQLWPGERYRAVTHMRFGV
jgi:aldose 1-epimerase